jgi:hypothetical protein
MSEIILNIKQVNKKSDGRPMLLIQTDVRDHWVTYAQWTSAGNSDNFEAYKNGAFDADYYVEGETLINGGTATASGILLKQFVATQDVAVTARTEAALIAERARGFRTASALFARNRQHSSTSSESAKL